MVQFPSVTSYNFYRPSSITDSSPDSDCQAYVFTDYWEDIGTLRSFFDANMALCEQVFFCCFQVLIC
jgi:ADP-glucose pyrophosphorylase